MTISALKELLTEYADRHFRIALPDGIAVPLSFHITEVGHLRKTFIDCGGKMRESTTCQLQVWVGPDFEHRIESRKMAAILDKAGSILTDDLIPVEIEYEDRVISQYTIVGHDLTDDAVILKLAHKHTECLAPELCRLPASNRMPAINVKSPCCGPKDLC